MIINCNSHSDCSDENMQRCQDYIQALEEERRKIQVFHRELPICLELVTQEIEERKQQLSGKTIEYNYNVISECFEKTSSEGPVLEDFIPIKRTLFTSVDDEQELKRSKNNTHVSNNDPVSKKSDWLRSVKLWNPTPDPPSKEVEDSPRKVSVREGNRNSSGGAFHPFRKEKSTVTTPQGPIKMSVPVAATNSVKEIGGGDSGSGSNMDKIFFDSNFALIVQKYRLHRIQTVHLIPNNSKQGAQFLVVGGILAPPPGYDAAMTTKTTAATCNQIYAPIASRPPHLQRQQHKQLHSDDQDCNTDDRVHSRSPANSSSTHPTTNSPAYSFLSVNVWYAVLDRTGCYDR